MASSSRGALEPAVVDPAAPEAPLPARRLAIAASWSCGGMDKHKPATESRHASAATPDCWAKCVRTQARE